MRNLGLGEILQLHGWVTRSQLNRALALQRRLAGRIGTSLLEIGAVTEPRLLTALSEQLGLPPATPEDLTEISQQVQAMLPLEMVVRWRALPFRGDGTRVWIVSDDPRNIPGLEELAFAAGRKIHMHVAPEVRIHEALDRYYGVPAPQRFARLARQLDSARAAQRRFALPELRIDGEFVPQEDLWGRLSNQSNSKGASGRTAAGNLGDAATGPPHGANGSAADPGSPPESPEDSGQATLAAVPKPSLPQIELSKTEREELLKPAVDPSATALVRARIKQTQRASEIGEALLDYLGPMASRVALFTAHSDHFEGWMATGANLDSSRFTSHVIDFQRPSTFLSLNHGVNFFVGPLADIPVHQEFLSLFDGVPPIQCLMVPIRLRRRLVAVLYVDRLQEDLPPFAPEPFKRLAEDAAKAFGNCILRNRLRSDKQARVV